MCQLYVLIYCLLYKVCVLGSSCLWDDVPAELFDPGLDVFLAGARHGRIFAGFAGFAEVRFVGEVYRQQLPRFNRENI